MEIRVQGLLTERPSFFAMLFGSGNTTYASLREALAKAQNDPDVSSVLLRVNSPGGNVDGLFKTLDALKSFPKEISSRAENANSAAYAIVAAAGSIEAEATSSSFGSIGVAASFFKTDYIIDITNTDSPKKRPD